MTLNLTLGDCVTLGNALDSCCCVCYLWQGIGYFIGKFVAMDKALESCLVSVALDKAILKFLACCGNCEIGQDTFLLFGDFLPCTRHYGLLKLNNAH